ncbi:NUDIX hydrolase [Roseivivax halodurans JCM 10272]|uniref:NUDIX hydrolase n=1 Tax=Roseivivax halodurans JCM 10272 TaxID=1449350 RepID=X7EB06_9RHOB|nr:NUDIX domain-containing protein [Roseivivax halodurans]ETX13040.1 NUDIX hydrolase [Roseivivax halodurans JCM 10272]
MSDTRIRAALAVVIRGEAVLLVRRANRPDAGLWGFPGGKLEAGETVAEAAIRELAEETGLTGTVRASLGTVFVDHVTPGYRLDAMLCDAPRGEPVAADDAEEAAWMPLADVIDRAIPMSRDVDTLAAKALEAIRTPRL